MTTLNSLWDNIFSKRKAAELLKQQAPNEASYLAGYCLECYLKCAIAVTQNYQPHSRTEIRENALWPFVHDVSKLIIAWRECYLVSDNAQFYALHSKITGLYQAYKIATDWKVECRYEPAWQFSDLEHVFQQELPRADPKRSA